LHTRGRKAVRRPSVDTHQECRSLIQKAVRRGKDDLAGRVARHLQEAGDAAWLRGRAAVITFEECWPLGERLPQKPDLQESVETLKCVARHVKVKDAAGLGTLAYALSKGDETVVEGCPEDRDIRIVLNAIRRPKDFWPWAVKQASGDRQRALVDAAYKAYRGGGWPWDRAFMQAAAYLAVTRGVPQVAFAKHREEEFPYWVALDKHTLTGKATLRETAKRLKASSQQVMWASFYCESAVVNESVSSYWWSREIRWRLKKVGLTLEMAQSLWQTARAIITDLLCSQAQALQQHLENGMQVKVDTLAHES
jgi:hypothetical protein